MLLDLETDGGVVGRSYLLSYGQHNLAPIVKLVEAMAQMVQGDAERRSGRALRRLTFED